MSVFTNVKRCVSKDVDVTKFAFYFGCFEINFKKKTIPHRL